MKSCASKSWGCFKRKKLLFYRTSYYLRNGTHQTVVSSKHRLKANETKIWFTQSTSNNPRTYSFSATNTLHAPDHRPLAATFSRWRIDRGLGNTVSRASESRETQVGKRGSVGTAVNAIRKYSRWWNLVDTRARGNGWSDVPLPAFLARDARPFRTHGRSWNAFTGIRSSAWRFPVSERPEAFSRRIDRSPEQLGDAFSYEISEETCWSRCGRGRKSTEQFLFAATGFEAGSSVESLERSWLLTGFALFVRRFCPMLLYYFTGVCCWAYARWETVDQPGK